MWRYPHLPVMQLAIDGRATGVRVFQARGFVARLFGLLGRRPLAAGEGLWIEPCSSIHTVGMRYAIDVALVDADNRVVATRRALGPLRLAAARRARRALELPANSLEALGIEPGRVVSMEAA